MRCLMSVFLLSCFIGCGKGPSTKSYSLPCKPEPPAIVETYVVTAAEIKVGTAHHVILELTVDDGSKIWYKCHPTAVNQYRIVLKSKNEFSHRNGLLVSVSQPKE
jgi:hypothetical protein